MRKQGFKNFTRCLVAAIALLLVWGGLMSAPVRSQLDYRLNTLITDINNIEARLNRIEARLSQSSQLDSPQQPIIPRSSAPPIRRNPRQLTRDQMFDRLATLVIELKQQVNKLEARVTKLESR